MGSLKGADSTQKHARSDYQGGRKDAEDGKPEERGICDCRREKKNCSREKIEFVFVVLYGMNRDVKIDWSCIIYKRKDKI